MLQRANLTPVLNTSLRYFFCNIKHVSKYMCLKIRHEKGERDAALAQTSYHLLTSPTLLANYSYSIYNKVCIVYCN